jgi:bifunctional UDP-N-acetylglucosamine pyrophosphorylase / glucosamine-1-phosphate N-acetyltransferase
MADLHVIVMAAGKGTRMKSLVPKILHRAAGLPLIEHVLRVVDPLRPSSIVVIVGHQPETVRAALSHRPNVEFAIQEPQLGTGHAVLQAESLLSGRGGCVLLLSGDVPLVRPGTVERLLEWHRSTQAAATLLTASIENPDGYGRIVRRDGRVAAIVEHRDTTPEQRAIREINSGIYAFDLPPLFPALRAIGSSNAQREYYLPDLVRIFRQDGLGVEATVLEDPNEILGVNSRKELADVARILNERKTAELMESGVTLVDPATTWIHPDVAIGPDTVVHPNVYLEGHTRIGAGCEIHAGVRIVDSVLGDRVVVNNFCVIRESQIDSGAQIGPFAQLRPQSHVHEDAHIGNFVELKKTTMGKGSKANHLAYLGDSTIGERVNIGAGTITCNYDGVAKHPTVIEDGAFIGSDSQLVAPVTVGKGAYVAAGSTVTENVPAGALAISRGKQLNKEGWAERKRASRLKARSAGGD